MRLHKPSTSEVSVQPPGSPAFTLVELTVLTAILGLLITVAVPNFVRNRKTAQSQLCIHNLNRIDAAKATWALDSGLGSDTEPYWDELSPYFSKQGVPACPAGGDYDLGLVEEPTLCTMDDFGHASEAGLQAYQDDAPPSGGNAADESRKPRKVIPGRGRHR